MSNRPHAGTTDRRCRASTTRRQLLSAIGGGALGGACAYGFESTLSDTPDRKTLASDHEVRIGDRTANVQVAVPKAHYQRVVDADHSFAETFLAARRQPYLTTVTAELAERAPDRASAIRAAQSLAVRIAYATDEESTEQFEFIRYPAETLVHGCGDCEDKAILLAGLLSRPPLDCRTALLIVPGHCATLVAREDVSRELIAADPLLVTLGGTDYVYFEAVERIQPGRAALDYGDRPEVAAYDGHWTVLNVEVLLKWGWEALDRHGFDLVSAVIG